MTKRPTLAERFSQSKAVAGVRAKGLKRLDRATRERLAPIGADAAVGAYAGVARKLADRMERAVSDAVDAGLDLVSLNALEAKLLQMTRGMERSARAAAKRIDTQARRELGRILQVKLPARDERDRVLMDLFVDQNMRYYRAMVLDLTSELQARLARGLPPDKLKQASWIPRVRAPLIAKDQSWKLEGTTQAHWAVQAGEDAYDWLTCHDDRVRPGHARLDGTTHMYSDPPDTGAGEGHNNPGMAIHCRCRGVPRGAYRLDAQARK